jgi:hypothetical protein
MLFRPTMFGPWILAGVLSASFSLAAPSLSAAGRGAAAQPKVLTAFQARKIADRAVSPDVRDRLLEIWGPRSPVALTPTRWQFIYYDPSAGFHGRKVAVVEDRLGAVESAGPDWEHLRMLPYEEGEVIEPFRLRVDSDRALHIVESKVAWKGVRLSTVTFWLRKDPKQGPAPYWRLRFFADKEGYEQDIGYAEVAADTGEIRSLRISPEKALPAAGTTSTP